MWVPERPRTLSFRSGFRLAIPWSSVFVSVREQAFESHQSFQVHQAGAGDPGAVKAQLLHMVQVLEVHEVGVDGACFLKGSLRSRVRVGPS